MGKGWLLVHGVPFYDLKTIIPDVALAIGRFLLVYLFEN